MSGSSKAVPGWRINARQTPQAVRAFIDYLRIADTSSIQYLYEQCVKRNLREGANLCIMEANGRTLILAPRKARGTPISQADMDAITREFNTESSEARIRIDARNRMRRAARDRARLNKLRDCGSTLQLGL